MIDFLKFLKIQIGFRSKRMFNPFYQKRTSWREDIEKKKHSICEDALCPHCRPEHRGGMGIMQMWENWSRRQYDIWGKDLQKKYDFWKEYDDPKMRARCQLVWNSMSADLQSKIYNMLIAILQKYGPEFAREVIKSLSEVFNKIIPTNFKENNK